jgi:hypothetical protein
MGCTCPVQDNNHGLSPPRLGEHGVPLWWFTAGCPVHIGPAGGDADTGDRWLEARERGAR